MQLTKNNWQRCHARRRGGADVIRKKGRKRLTNKRAFYGTPRVLLSISVKRSPASHLVFSNSFGDHLAVSGFIHMSLAFSAAWCTTRTSLG